MNNYYKMNYVSNLNDIFNHIKMNSHHANIFINLDNTIKLLNLTPIIYKNNPFLRTKLISNTKTYDFTKKLLPYNYFLKKIAEEVNNDIKKIYVITNTNEHTCDMSSNIIMIDCDQFDNIINKIENSILIIDTNENASRQLKDKQNIHVIILRAI